METHEAKRATHALMEHLQRIGVQQLPAVDESAARKWVAQHFSVSSEQTRATPESTSAPPRVPSEEIAPALGHARRELPKPAPRSMERPQRLAPASAVQEGPGEYAGPKLPTVERSEQLSQCAAQVDGCTRCSQLAFARKNTVFGEGNPDARVCFFGEGPGADEDRQGRPFVGRSGQLLTKMIQACTFSRDDVYILNTVKCRPPGNRNPEPNEIENCRGYFEHQLDIIQPEYIVCLGLVAARALLHTPLSVGRLRGSFHRYRSSKVVVTYHPSYLLRTPEAKRAAWTDLQMMLKDMGIDPGAAKSKR